MGAAGAIAHRPHAGGRGPQPFIDLDEAPVVPFDPGGLQADAVGVRGPAARNQEVRSLDHAVRRVQPYGLAGSPLHARDARGRQHLDPLVVEEFPQRFRDVAIFAVSQGVVPLNDRNATAEASQGLGHLESDIAAPQNEEVLRDAVQFEGLDVRHRPRFGEAGDWVDPRAGARADHDDFAAKGARTVVGRHLDRSRPDEAALPLDKLRAALSIRIDITSDNAIDHLPLAVADSWHLDFPVARGDAEFGALCGNSWRPWHRGSRSCSGRKRW